jgi:hypothetical protein
MPPDSNQKSKRDSSRKTGAQNDNISLLPATSEAAGSARLNDCAGA